MGKASDEIDLVVHTIQMGVVQKAFTKDEIKAMLMSALKSMTIAQMDELLEENTSYKNWMDLFNDVI
jgi:hypothetical protein